MNDQNAEIKIELPKNLEAIFAHKFSKPSERVKELAILELYRQGEISGGKAGELIGMERLSFIQYASKLGIPFIDMSEEDLKEDLKNSKSVSRQ